MTGTRPSSAEYARVCLRLVLGIFLLAPYIIWIFRIPQWTVPDAHEWWPALTTAIGQATLSAACALVVGGILFMALQGWRASRVRTLVEFALLLPNMVPPLFLALGLLNIVSPFMAFPYGVGAVILAHVILNSGLVAISLDRLIHSRLGGMAEVCWLMGAPKKMFWREVAWPYLRADLACLFLFVFSMCFTSFSLPLLLSGDRASTIEVLIYDMIRIEGRWDKAVLLAATQALVLLGLAWLLPQPFWPPRPTRRDLSYLSWARARWIVVIPALILFIGWVAGAVRGARAPWAQGVLSTLPQATLMTFILAFAVGLLHLILFLLIAFVSPHRSLRRFLNGYLSPSPVITGFALLLIPGEGEVLNTLKIIVALTMISLPLLYRWIVHSALAGVTGQVAMARTLGASWTDILFQVVWPQIYSPVMRACGLAALWASGDFALTGILGNGLLTLPLVMENLVGNYRMEQAGLLLVPLVIVGLGTYYLFVRVGRYVAS